MKWAFLFVAIISIPAFAQDKPATKVLSVRLNFPEKAKFKLRLYNYDGDHLLWSHNGKSQGEGELFLVDPKPYVEYGLRKFKLVILTNKNKKVDSVFFRVDQHGTVIKE